MRTRSDYLSNLRHDLAHLHCLTGRHFVDADYDLIIRRARGLLQKLPDALQQFALVLRGATRTDQEREGGRCRSLSRGEAASRRIVLKDDVYPVSRDGG